MSGDPRLQKTLGPVMLWGLGVGYVISGEYFGWNLGLPAGGAYGMLVATLVITVMYVAFVLSYAELACALPRAGGVFVYATRGLGPYWGFVAGLVQVIEFVFAPPAIAMAIGAYVTQRFTTLDVHLVAIGAYVVFTALNAWGVKQSAWFELAVTVLAVGELLVFIGVVGPSFSLEQFQKDPLPHGISGVFACIPFAIWFYLAIEGVANAAEEARNPQRDVVVGFGSAIATLVVLALLVFFAAVGVAGWAAVVYPPGGTVATDAPLPLALAQVVPRQHLLYTLLLGIGLLGLVASFHGIILAAGRATMAMGRSGLAPRWLGRIHPKAHTPVAALLANTGVGVVAILSGKTAEIITLACFGALALYILAMLALLRLRRTEPALVRPYRTPAYPYLPLTALIIASLSLVAVGWYNLVIGAIFVCLLGIGSGYYVWISRREGKKSFDFVQVAD
jgi:ethanolamine permease